MVRRVRNRRENRRYCPAVGARERDQPGDGHGVESNGRDEIFGFGGAKGAVRVEIEIEKNIKKK